VGGLRYSDKGEVDTTPPHDDQDRMSRTLTAILQTFGDRLGAGGEESSRMGCGHGL